MKKTINKKKGGCVNIKEVQKKVVEEMEKDFQLKPFAKDIAELPKKSFYILCKILKKNK